MMGMAPPRTPHEVNAAYQQFDTNRDGLISSMEMLYAFKNMQGINSGMQMQPNMMNQMRF
jgi:Ca2+-binding EF-hand superfamily protein